MNLASVLYVNKAYFISETIYSLGALLKIFREERKRSKALILLLLPAVIFLWVIGWSLYWIGHQKEHQKMRQTDSQGTDHVHFMLAVLEEPLDARSE